MRALRTSGAIVLFATAALGIADADAQTRARAGARPEAAPSGREADSRLAAERAAQAGELERLRDRSVELAALAQQTEVTLSAAEMRLTALNGEADALSAAMAVQRTQLGEALMALNRAARRPALLAAVDPAAALDAARSARLMAAVVRHADASASSFERTRAQLDASREHVAREQREAADAALRLDAERHELETVMQRRGDVLRALEGDAAGVAQRLAALGTARDAAELIARLLGAEAVPAAAAGFGAARGQLLWPVRGAIVRRFGQAPASDARQRGVIVAPRASAQVVAPAAGRVVFAGPFRSYGRILILEHGEGYHMLLAGFGRIEATVGRWVTAGEPLGVAAQPETGNPSLYIELRRAGQPIDPIPWFAAPKER